MYGPFRTLQESKAAAYAEQTRRQCATGRHVYGCPHRPGRLAPATLRAMSATLQAKVVR